MLQLERLINDVLPVNRNEKYFSDTLFPMVVCKDNFRHFNRFLTLAGLDHFYPAAKNWNSDHILLLTEYSLQEGILSTFREKYPDLSNDPETPDIVIYIHKPIRYIIALDTVMYKAISAEQLEAKLDSRMEFLRLMAKEMNAVYAQFAILPHSLLHSYKNAFTGPVITWEQLSYAYRDTGPDYFLDMLNFSIKKFPDLVSNPSMIDPDNPVRHMIGQRIFDSYNNGTFKFASVGRSGGLGGERFVDDITSGHWRTRRYEVTEEPPRNRNWFYVELFVQRILEIGSS
jgi:hypothetical protein